MSEDKEGAAGPEGIIPRKDMDTFLKVTRALKTIRDKRLYRQEFPSFDAYCRSRMGLDGATADLYIAFGDVELEARRTKPNWQ